MDGAERDQLEATIASLQKQLRGVSLRLAAAEAESQALKHQQKQDHQHQQQHQRDIIPSPMHCADLTPSKPLSVLVEVR